MKKTLLFSGIAMFLAGNLTVAMAEGESKDSYPHKGKMFEKMDVDSNGIVSKEEYTNQVEQRFAKMDANGDNNITKEEAESYYSAKKDKYKEEDESSTQEKAVH